MSYRGLMDGWHGDEPEIAVMNNPWEWENEPEDEWDDRRRQDLEQTLNLEDGLKVSNFDLLNKHIKVLQNMWRK